MLIHVSLDLVYCLGFGWLNSSARVKFPAWANLRGYAFGEAAT